MSDTPKMHITTALRKHAKALYNHPFTTDTLADFNSLITECVRGMTAAADWVEVLEDADRRRWSGCGEPGHVGAVPSDEGTHHCETCRAIAAEAEIERLTKLLDSGHLNTNLEATFCTIKLPKLAISWRDALSEGDAK